MNNPSRMPQTEPGAARRRNVARTAWIVGAIAMLIYVGFILSGVVGR